MAPVAPVEPVEVGTGITGRPVDLVAPSHPVELLYPSHPRSRGAGITSAGPVAQVEPVAPVSPVVLTSQLHPPLRWRRGCPVEPVAPVGTVRADRPLAATGRADRSGRHCWSGQKPSTTKLLALLKLPMNVTSCTVTSAVLLYYIVRLRPSPSCTDNVGELSWGTPRLSNNKLIARQETCDRRMDIQWRH